MMLTPRAAAIIDSVLECERSDRQEQGYVDDAEGDEHHHRSRRRRVMATLGIVSGDMTCSGEIEPAITRRRLVSWIK